MNICHNCNGAGKEEDIIEGCPKCPYCDGTRLMNDDADDGEPFLIIVFHQGFSYVNTIHDI
jgi:hypothetical protein